MKKSKLKIKTNGKEYSLKDSPFYNIKTKKRLSILIGCTLSELKAFSKDQGNYHEFLEKSTGGKSRKIQQPVRGLDRIHTRIASLLCRIETPDYLHSGKKNHSNVSNAKTHAEKHFDNVPTMTTDIKSFFPSTTRKMIFSFFYSVMKCSADVADVLADICTIHKFLPTGSRISMPLAFWANSRMFEELEALSIKHDIVMTVYVDDLTFSGCNVNKLFKTTVKRVIERHQHTMHPDKTKIYRKAEPKLVTGVVVHNGEIRVRNEQHKQLVTDLACWNSIKAIPEAIRMPYTNRLIGRLHSMGVIESVFKDKATAIRNQTAK
ncbi:RNA-directed DNA polymerase [Vibrio parahaemolyticus]|jgi:hypothetical protein|uniref:reverse transcriptase family protein n=1 Tax=Vibrio TaxID=662 RepID=UPI0003143C8F|nr:MULTISPECIES: reverse transcriptase family protein [Vibrio]EGR0800423.1 RNA-directed DNA polymerase [Vibrio alginolyticus]EGR1390133.1 RNA-directed DNA polymerase [Vibrio parahaemolyticus]EGR1578397.1 RNA-directed DNA polymerase [Vibrio parahaemolyticus]EJY0896666.1 RNA-directed DNA polymerase [Vibrio parahaemolyticus]ELA7345504.1 RNA-directed DNA polymerase [Vibrio parahaemolyticus]